MITSLTVTPKWFLTFLTSSRSSRAKATLRRALITPLSLVRGAENGAAIARPARVRRTMSTTALKVAGTTSGDQEHRSPHESGKPVERHPYRARPARQPRPGPAAVGRVRRCTAAREVAKRHTVGRGVMDLEQDGKAIAVERAVGALDHPHLP